MKRCFGPWHKKGQPISVGKKPPGYMELGAGEMTLPLDLNSLDSDETFEQLCFRLTRREYPDAIPIAHGSWDGGRDIVRLGRRGGDIVWQCKMTRQNIARIKPKIRESLDALDKMQPIHRWILCVSVDASGSFLDWLRNTLVSYPFINQWEIWGRTEILRRLENSPDIVEVFFYPIWKSFEQRFRTDDIELVEFEMEHGIGWSLKSLKWSMSAKTTA